MKNLSKTTIFSCAFRFIAVCLLILLASHCQTRSICAADAPPAFSSDRTLPSGRFEKFSRKQISKTTAEPAVESEESTVEPTEPSLKQEDTNDSVIPLPPIEEEATPQISMEDTAEEQPALPDDQPDSQWPNWLKNYRKACQDGKDHEKMVLVYFYDTQDHSPYAAFESESLKNEEIATLLGDYVCVRIPVTGKVPPLKQLGDLAEETSTEDRHVSMRPSVEKVDVAKLIVPGRNMGSVAQLKAEDYDLTFPEIEEEIMLIEHPAFYEMLNTPGVAIIDFKHKDAAYYGDVVSVFPFLNKKPYTVEQTKAMLTLPPGTVTQRSVIFAVRIHPDKPKSTDGEVNARLVEEARSHSQYQADIRKQGHHNWNRRFQQINIELPTELWACEVCAESWPGQHLLESAIECVACWRFSEGHWSAVSAEHPYYGYDMKLGTNGIWYGTGVFGKWRHQTLARAGTLTVEKTQPSPKR